MTAPKPEAPEVVPQVTGIPERIFLQLGNPHGSFPFDEIEPENITWCASRISDSDLEYHRTPPAPSGDAGELVSRLRHLADQFAAGSRYPGDSPDIRFAEISSFVESLIAARVAAERERVATFCDSADPTLRPHALAQRIRKGSA